MFLHSEKYYDAIYGSMGKDYVAEAKIVHGLIQKHKRSKGKALLDIACGTGSHAGALSKYYKVDGSDYDKGMLVVARRKYPNLKFEHGNMIDFSLKRKFDIITCLFSSIGYVRTKANLRKAITTMADHLVSGGVLLVEPWFTPSQWNTGRVYTNHVNDEDLKITRMSFSNKKGNVSSIDFHYLIGSSAGVEHITERHELGLFTHEEYMTAFQAADLKTFHDPKGLDGRGLYIGIKA
mgnify:FL=1